MNKEIEKALNSVSGIKDKARQELAKVKEEIDAQNKVIVNESRIMDNAVVTGDYSAYEKAQENIAVANNKMDMLKKRYSMLQGSSGVSFEDGVSFMKLVHSEQEKEVLIAKEKLKPLLAEVRSVINEACKNIGDGNEVLTNWHNNIRKFSEADAPTTSVLEDLYFQQSVWYKGGSVLNECKHELNKELFYTVAGEPAPAPTYNKLF